MITLNRVLRRILRKQLIDVVPNESPDNWKSSNSDVLRFPSSCQIQGLANIYEAVFSGRIGTFVEVGAWDGFEFSNTWGLINQGWIGHYVEPGNIYQRLVDNVSKFPGANTYNFGIGNSDSNALFYELGPYSSFRREEIERVRNSDWYRENWILDSHEVQFLTANKFLEISGCKSIDLLVIDVEGSDFEVLRSFLVIGLKPRMVICEISSARGEDICNYLINDANFQLIYKDAINVVAVWRG